MHLWGPGTMHVPSKGITWGARENLQHKAVYHTACHARPHTHGIHIAPLFTRTLQGDTAVNIYTLVHGQQLQRPMVHDIMFSVGVVTSVRPVRSTPPPSLLFCACKLLHLCVSVFCFTVWTPSSNACSGSAIISTPPPGLFHIRVGA